MNDQSPNFERAVLADLSELRMGQAVTSTKLTTLIELVSDLQADLDGNGRVGIKDRLTRVETRVEERTSPSKATMAGIGALGGAVTMLVDFLREWMAKGAGS